MPPRRRRPPSFNTAAPSTKAKMPIIPSRMNNPGALALASIAIVITGCRDVLSFSPKTSVRILLPASPLSSLLSGSSNHDNNESRFNAGAASIIRLGRRRSSGLAPLAIAAADVIRDNDDGEEEFDVIGTVTLLVPSSSSESSASSSSSSSSKFGSKSPVSPPSYLEAAKQLARKIRHFSDGRVAATVVTVPSGKNNGGDDELDDNDPCIASNALFALGLTSPSDMRYLSRTFRRRRENQQHTNSLNKCQFAIDCGTNEYAPTVGPSDAANPPLLASIAPWSDAASGQRLSTQMSGLFTKYSTDEFALAAMLFFNRFSGTSIPWVQHSIDVTWEKGPIKNAQEIYAMITKCGPCILRCLSDENCKECIMALDEIDTRDQVSSYRTVVSYESALLRDFSLCILQKNNVFECEATIPKLPKVKPLGRWRGMEMTVEVARGIMIGHLEGVRSPLREASN